MFLYRTRNRRGFTLLSLLMVLMIIGILTQTYMTMEGPEGQTYTQTMQGRARAAVTAANLRTAQTQFFMDTEGRRLPPDQLRQRLDVLSNRLGGDGRFFADQNMNLYTTVMMEPPLFRDQFHGVPHAR